MSQILHPGLLWRTCLLLLQYAVQGALLGHLYPVLTRILKIYHSDSYSPEMMNVVSFSGDELGALLFDMILSSYHLSHYF